MKLIHIGILTPSLEDSIRGLQSFPDFAEAKWLIREVEFPPEAVLTGKGSPMRTAIANLGGMTCELIQPLAPTSYHAEELRKKGECRHHTAFMCLENQQEVVESQLKRGGKIVWEAQAGEKHPIYVESPDGKQVWEFINYPRSAGRNLTPTNENTRYLQKYL